MKALASLSKFLGRYDEWFDIVKKYQLKWFKPGRSVDVFKSIVDSTSQLFKTKGNEYIDNKRGLLNHYQFPSLFLGQTKNAYLSIIDDHILEIAKNTPNRECYYNSLRKKISTKKWI